MTSHRVLELLRSYESRNVTFIDPDGSWPIVWERARDVHVWDCNGRKYLDLSAAFGVAATGHANPRVVRAGQRQMARLLHAMGDVHPHALKAELARELSRLTFERLTKPKVQTPKLQAADDGTRRTRHVSPRTRHALLSGKTIFCNSGFEAVEAALKTAFLATGKPGVIAFSGAYHGLGYGALNATHREHFRSPFRAQLREFALFAPFPTVTASGRQQTTAIHRLETRLRSFFRSQRIGAILVEPIQGRGGINIPEPGFLPLLRRLCTEHGAVLILDEIFTGLGRTGKWFACEHWGIVPDLICLGKALTGGFPLSACVGRADIMDAAWPRSTGEAIHTSTFLGHPVGCAMALAQIEEIRRRDLVSRSAELGGKLLAALESFQAEHSSLLLSARGVGLLAGLELRLPQGQPATDLASRAIKEMLQSGFILLPEGEHANVLSFSPPLTITGAQIDSAMLRLGQILSQPL